MADRDIDYVIDSITGDPDYIKFLLVERPYIRSALEAKGFEFDPVARTLAYSSGIGNALHNDVIELEIWLNGLSPQDRNLLLRWAESAGDRVSLGVASMRRIRGLISQYGESNVKIEKNQADGSYP